MKAVVVAQERPPLYMPHRQQKRLHLSTARYRNVCAGRRGGKSKSCGREFLKSVYQDLKNPDIVQASRSNPLQYWAVAPTEELTVIQLRELRAGCLEHGLPFQFAKGDLVATIPGWPVIVRFRSAFTISQLVGEDVWGMWLDEAAKIKPDAWGYLEPCLTSTAGWVLTSTTPEGQNWYYDEFWEKGDPLGPNHDPRFENFHFTSADNPFLARICVKCLHSYRAESPGWKRNRCTKCEDTTLVSEAVWKRRHLPERIYRREYLAAFDAFFGQVWDELTPTQHWVPLPEKLRFKRLVGGQDWNYALPGAFVLCGEDVHGKWWVLDEIQQERLPVTDDEGDCWVSRIKALAAIWEKRVQARLEVIYADPANPEHIDSERRKNLPVRAGDNAVSAGIQSIAVLSHPVAEKGARLLFAAQPVSPAGALVPNAKRTWRQVVSYRFEAGTEKPVKEDDHGCDALRYAIHSAAGPGLRRLGMVSGRIAQ